MFNTAASLGEDDRNNAEQQNREKEHCNPFAHRAT